MRKTRQELLSAANRLANRFGAQIVSQKHQKSLQEQLLRQNSKRTSREEHLKLLLKHQAEIANAAGSTKDFLEFYHMQPCLSNSQWAQDIFAIFATKGKHGGSYLEIGGADGITHSNTLTLHEEYGWSGVLVEPDRHQYRVLSECRPNDVTLNCAISPKGDEKTLQLITLGQLSCVRGQEPNDTHQEWRSQSTETQTVAAISINSLLSGDTPIDYFSLDVEGMEIPILQQIDWESTIPPQCMTVEHNFQPEKKAQIISLLQPLGYREAFPEQDWLTRGDTWLIRD